MLFLCSHYAVNYAVLSMLKTQTDLRCHVSLVSKQDVLCRFRAATHMTDSAATPCALRGSGIGTVFQ
jgi:hypothetical protein